MSYITSTLSKDEEIKVTPKLHWINYAIVVFCLVFAGICGKVYLDLSPDVYPIVKIAFIAPIAIFAFATLIFTLRIWLTEMAVTTKRVVFRTGIISVHTEELKIARIESVELRQSILGRILNYGSLYFSGTGTGKVLFPNIQKPREMKALLEDVVKD